MRVVSTGLALALARSFAAPAGAGGINLSWNDCGESGIANRISSCTSNATVSVLFVSTYPSLPKTQLNGAEIVLWLESSTPTLSPWWNLQPAGCRAGAVVGAFNFLAGPFNCVDPWAGLAAGGVAYNLDPYTPSRARLRGVVAVASGVPASATEDLYLFKFVIHHSKTTGTDACAGCLDPMCLVLGSVKLTQPLGVGDELITNPAVRSHVTWQGGPGGPWACPGVVPVRNQTWGALKSLYR